MPDDSGGVRPQITRTNSLFPNSGRSTVTSNPSQPVTTGPAATVGPTYTGTRLRIENPSSGRASRNVNTLVPRGFRLVENHGGYIIVERTGGQEAPTGTRLRPGDEGFVGPTATPLPSQRVTPQSRADERTRQQDRANNFGRRLTSEATSINGVIYDNALTAAQAQRLADQQSAANSVFSPLNMTDVDASAQFVMSYGAVIDPTTGKRSKTGNLEAHGIYGSADAMERRTQGMSREQIDALAHPGTTQNMMTVAAGVQWLRRLSVTDPGAYNQMVILLRNAGYLNGADEDLPLNGWTRDVGMVFARAAQDLSDAAADGEQRDLKTWLAARGQAYVDAAANGGAGDDPYQPVDRSYQDPEAVKQTAKEAAINALGRALTPEEEVRFEATFRGKEDSFYDQVDAVGRAQHDTPGSPGARVAQPNLGAQAEAFVGGDEYDTERAGQALGAYGQAFMRLMGVNT